MNILGVLFLFCCIIVGFLAFYFEHKENYRLSIFLLLLLGFGLRAYAASDFNLHCWDERYHALVAKNMIQYPLQPFLYRNALLPYDYTNWTINHVWLHKQPLSLWLMAFSLKMFGINEFAVRFPSVLFSTISIWLVYSIGKYFSDKKVAFLAAFFFAINGLIIEICAGRVATDHPDTLFVFFILLSIFFVIKFIELNGLYNLLVGVSLGVALLTKWLPALIVLPIWLVLVWDTKKYTIRQIIVQFVLIVGTAMIVFLPWQFYIHFQFPKEAIWERIYNTRHFWETLEGQGGTWYYYINRIRIDYGELIYLPIIWVFYRFARNLKELKLLALIVWFAIPIIFFSIAATKMNGYLLIGSPALFIICSVFFYELKATIVNSKLVWFKRLVLILMIGLPIRYCIERLKPFDTTNKKKPQWVVDLKNWNQKENSKAVLFGYNAPIEAMFYTNATVYEVMPSSNTIVSLQKLGYTIFITDYSMPSKELKDLKGVTVVHFENAQY